MTDEGSVSEIFPTPAERAIELFSRNEIRELHALIRDEFADYYEKSGYHKETSAPLVSGEDKSVLFTGASISAVKSILLSGRYPQESKGVYLDQECLRTKALKHAFDNDYIPFGQTYFHMSTILSKPGRFEDATMEALDFTINHLGIDVSRVLIRSTKELVELKDVDNYAGVSVVFDDHKPSYYQWGYGIPGVHGEGVAICILNPADRKYWDVGNIVRIVNSQNKELGIEFGYGWEFLLTAMVGVQEPLNMSQIFELYPLEEGLPKKYFSYMEAVVRAKLAGLQIGSHEAEHVYKQYLKSLQFMGATMGKDVDMVIDEMSKFKDFLGAEEVNFSLESNFMKKHFERKEHFAEITKRVGKYLWAQEHGQKPKEIIKDPWGMVQYYLNQNGIDPLEVANDLARLKRFKKYSEKP